ncbi:hypothetical protein [Clostridium sp.]
MVHKSLLKKINSSIQWIVGTAMIGVCIYYIFIDKNIFKGMMMIIMCGGIIITNAGSIINNKFYEGNFSWKNNWWNIMQVCIFSIFIVGEIILNYRY